MNKAPLHKFFPLKISFILLGLFFFCLVIKAQTNNLMVEHLTLLDGIPDRCINCIFQDRLGFIWFGTRDGLVKYDGYKMTVYKHDKNDSTSIGGVWVGSIAEDREGNIWLAGNNGIYCYSRTDNNFINFKWKMIVPFPYIDVNVAHNGYHFSGYGGVFSKILIDNNENLWIGTYSYGLYKLPLSQFKEDLKSSNFKLVFHDLEIEGTQSINSIVEDVNQNIWIGTNNGLIKILNGENKPLLYQSVKSVKYNIKNHITDIIVDDENILWLATFGNGLCKFNISNETFRYISLKTSNDPEIFTNSIYSISMDKSGIIWCGMRGNSDEGGVVSVNSKTEKFVRYLNDHNKEFSIGPYKWWVNDIFIDFAGTLWLGYREGPLDRVIPENNIIKYFSPNDYKKEGSTNQTVYDFQPLNDSLTLILTGSGILLFNIESAAFTQKFPFLNNRISSIPGQKTLLLDSKGIIWIGCTNGILKFDENLSKIEFLNLNSIRKGAVVTEDDNYDYWIGTFGDGLIKYNNKTNQKKYFKHDPSNPQTIKDDYINHIYNDETGNIWLGSNGGWFTRFNKDTRTAENYKLNASYISKVGPFNKDEVWITTGGGGFFIFNKLTKKFRQYSKNQGLPHEEVHGINKDRNNFYWVITTNAISKYDPQYHTLRSYNVCDNNNLIKSSYQADYSKIIFLSGANGFYCLNPDDINSNPYAPQMILTDFKIYNKSLVNDKDSILKDHINVAKQITLNQDMNDFTIEFAALHFSDPLQNEYKYILENFDNNWLNAGFETTARYTSLPAGDYKFKVVGANSDGIWATEPATLSITILPPWWLTWWAYMIYVLAIISLLTYVWSIQKRRIRIRHEMELKDFESQKLREVDQMKSKFFANISHEFRTPLTLIKGPIERLLKKENTDEKRNIYKVVLRNSERLLNLINELLDLSKLESGKMKLSAQKADIVSFTKSIAMSFESFARGKKIQISITTSSDIIEVYFDKEKMQKILTNLLSNAFKFTNESGKITLRIEENIVDKKLLIRIKDSGIGIPEEELPKIFDRFYQVSNTDSTDHIGTGIGLSMTKELVEMHSGKIKAESEVGKGSEFTISLLLGKDHLKEEELIYAGEDSDTKYEDEEEGIEITDNAAKDKPLILVVEDNKDVRDFIIGIIESQYKYEEAENGEEGLNKAIELMPDLIMSDIMMPKLTGDLMCSKLKKYQVTSHIPIILLTAKASGEDKISGLETGADDYLIKPFNDKELLARINNLILQRRKLREKYLREAEIHPAEIAVTSFDKKFIERTINIVEENISNTNFSIEQFASELLLSKAQLYRKFNSILGEKPNEFIRKYRIKRAAELIKQNYGNITQIAYEVGFNDLSYFTKCFKKFYHVTPHMYEKEFK